MIGLSIQDHLFQRIREKLPANESLPDKIAELLFISNDSAYRRIRGETPLVLDEAKILCEHFSISLDLLLEVKDKSVCFNSFSVNAKEYSFDKYLDGIVKSLKKLLPHPDAEIIYLSKDIALFHNFYFRPLFAFRYFFWMKSIIQDPSFQNKKFSMDILPQETEERGKELLKLYEQFSSIEIWNTECVNSLISQIEFYREAGYLQSDDLSMIYDAMTKTIHHIKFQAEEGAKFLPGEVSSSKKTNFQLFQNRIFLGDNTIMVKAAKKKTVYLNYELLNYMVTQDEVFCQQVDTNIHDLMKRSTLLSIANEKQRNIFFNILLRKIPAYNKMAKDEY
jgi:hypothetical protein